MTPPQIREDAGENSDAEPSAQGSAIAWAIAGALVLALGIGLRVHNAFDYPVGKGFDATHNWDYIALLLERWHIPSPDTMWATSHPPLYYWIGAGIGALLPNEASTLVPWIRIVGSAFGLAGIALGARYIRAVDPAPRRVFFALALPLLLPVHLYASAMLNEEVVAAAWVTAALVALLYSRRDETPTWASVMLVGFLCGLAILTKVSGVLVLATAAATYAIDGWRRGSASSGFGRAIGVGIIGSVVGGWFFAHNLWVYGYIYPFKLDVHAIMATMPPGERSVFDYLYVPLATFLQPVVLGPDLIRSVWGGTYATLWFDAHHHFLPRPTQGLVEWGAALTVLGSVPTAAFAVGVSRGVRRAIAGVRGADIPLLIALVLTLLGYVAFTWRNPWFPTTKASYLLGLTLPFTFYASEVLADWTRPGRAIGAMLRFMLAFLAILVALTFCHGLLFAKHDDPGVPWRPLPPKAQSLPSDSPEAASLPTKRFVAGTMKDWGNT